MLLSFVLLSFAAFAQNDSVVSSENNTHFFFGIGTAGQQFSGLGSRIASRPEYQSLKKVEVNISLGVIREEDNILTEYNFTMGSSFSGDRNKRSSNLASVSSSISIGVNLSKSKKNRFYPFVGIEVNSYAAKFNKDISAIPFDSVLQSNSWQQKTEPLSLSNTFIGYRAGLSFDIIDKTNNRLSTSFRAGYTGSFGKKDWRVNGEQELLNAPTDKLGRWFFTVQFMKKYKKKSK